MTTTQMLYNFLIDSSLSEFVTTIGISKESLDRISKLWKDHQWTDSDSVLDFVQTNDFDDKEKIMIGCLLFHVILINKVKSIRE